MIDKLLFYIRHSLNDLSVNKQRTLFALLCIAAGVSAIVSLQMLGTMIEDSLTGSLQASNGGDLQIRPVEREDAAPEKVAQGREVGVLEASSASIMGGRRDEESSYFFSAAGYQQITDWFTTNAPASQVTFRRVLAGGHGPMGAGSITDLRTGKDQMFVASFFVDVGAYPLYGTRESEDGTPLAEMIQSPTDIVINRELADTLDANVGDRLRVNGSSSDFVLRGIVPTDSEAGFENLGASLFGIFYLHADAAASFVSADLGLDRIYVRLDDPARLEEVETAFEAQYPYLSVVTTADLEAQNTEASDTINQLVTVMGLVSLLIGGIGIVNTMQGVVSRRTTEIAILKTLGLEGEQITVLFLVEALLMGLLGSLLGIVLGWLAAYLFKNIAGAFVAQSLSLRLTPGPAITGLIVGLVVTAIFGFLPTLSAGQVRPNLVLRPNDTPVPSAGRAQSVLALLVVIAALSVVAQPLLNDLLVSGVLRLIAGGVGAGLGLLAALLFVLMVGVRRGWAALALSPLGFAFGYALPALLILTGSFIVVAVLYAILWMVIWLVGRFFPAGPLVDLQVALRSMLAAKGRGAATLLALVIGVFTLSLITMLATVVSNQLEEMLVKAAGGNVVIFASGQGDTLEQLQARLATVPGVNSYTVVGSYNVELVALEDTSAGERVTAGELQDRVDRALGDTASVGPGHLMNQLSRTLGTIDARGVTSNLPEASFYRGRQLTAADAGKPYIIIPANDTTLAAGLDVGDQLIFRLTESEQPVEMTFEIVGMIDRTGSQLALDVAAPNYAPADGFPTGLAPSTVSAIVDVNQDQIDDLRRSTADLPGIFLMETRLVNRLIRQFTSFPTLVASLALAVGGIVIANSVALAALERRREIGIMKAIGLQRERVLSMLLLENGLMGLIGGIIGVGISSALLLVLMIGLLGGSLGSTVPYLTALSLMMMCVGIALGAALVSAWGASGERPLNVLRYE